MGPTIVRQSRAKTAMATIGVAAFAAIGVVLLRDPDGGPRYSAEYMHLWGAIILALSAYLAGRLGLLLLKPQHLIMEPEGLTHVCLGRRRYWPWKATGAFRVEGNSAVSRRIFFESVDERDEQKTVEIAGAWTISVSTVCDELNAARARGLELALPCPAPYVG